MAQGVSGVFGPGTPLDEVTDFTFEQVAMIKAEKLVEDMGSELAERKSNI